MTVVEKEVKIPVLIDRIVEKVCVSHTQARASKFFWQESPPPPPRPSVECASGCPWSTARATAPSPGRLTPGVVKQDKSSGGSVDTTKTRSDPQSVRMSSGERPMGAAKDKQSDTEALCPPPPRP